MRKNIGKIISKNILIMLTASKRAIQKTSEKTVALIGNKTANRITKASKTSSQNNSVTNK